MDVKRSRSQGHNASATKASWLSDGLSYRPIVRICSVKFVCNVQRKYVTGFHDCQLSYILNKSMTKVT